jgi:hypothetical protein
MLQGLSWFLEQAHKDKGGIWLATPAGMFTGFPVTYKEYSDEMVRIGSLRRNQKSDSLPEATVELSAEAGLIFLMSTSIFSGNFTHHVGSAILDVDKVISYGWFSNLTTVKFPPDDGS